MWFGEQRREGREGECEKTGKDLDFKLDTNGGSSATLGTAVTITPTWNYYVLALRTQGTKVYHST